MHIEPVENLNFKNRIYKETITTSYGKCIRGGSGEHDYFVYIANNPVTKDIKHKLYVVNKTGGGGKENWIKSFLRFFSKDKMIKELRSQAK